MKRDMDLVRKLLLEIEQHGEPGVEMEVDLEGYSSDEVSYHVQLLHEAGFVGAQKRSRLGGTYKWNPKRLTWEGHEFLDAARNEGVWNEAQEVLRQKGGTVPLAVFQALLIEMAKRWIGLD